MKHSNVPRKVVKKKTTSKQIGKKPMHNYLFKCFMRKEMHSVSLLDHKDNDKCVRSDKL